MIPPVNTSNVKCEHKRDPNQNRYFPLSLQCCLLPKNFIGLEHYSGYPNSNKESLQMLPDENHQQQQSERKHLLNPPGSLLNIVSLIRRNPSIGPSLISRLQRRCKFLWIPKWENLKSISNLCHTPACPQSA